MRGSERGRDREKMCVCVCVCVCDHNLKLYEERETDGQTDRKTECVNMFAAGIS